MPYLILNFIPTFLLSVPLHPKYAIVLLLSVSCCLCYIVSIFCCCLLCTLKAGMCTHTTVNLTQILILDFKTTGDHALEVLVPKLWLAEPVVSVKNC